MYATATHVKRFEGLGRFDSIRNSTFQVQIQSPESTDVVTFQDIESPADGVSSSAIDAEEAEPI